MTWVMLFGAVATEIAAASGITASRGYTRPGWVVPSALGYALSIYLFGLVVRRIGVSAAYAVWTGAGTAAVALIGFAVFHEPVSPARVVFLALVVAGVVGLQLTAA